MYEYLEKNYEYIGDKYILNGFSIFLGMEVDIKDGGHVILSGNRSDLLKIREKLNKCTEKPDFIEFEALLELGEMYGCMMVGSHPYREDHKLYLQPTNLLSRLHALDLNATDIFNKGLNFALEEIESLSSVINLPYITGSDSHYPIQLGSVKTKFKDEFLTIQEIIEAINNREYSIEISKALDIKVFSAKTTKKIIKDRLVEYSKILS